MSSYKAYSDDDEPKTTTGGIPIVRDPMVTTHTREIADLERRIIHLEWIGYAGVVFGLGVFVETSFSLAMHAFRIW